MRHATIPFLLSLMLLLAPSPAMCGDSDAGENETRVDETLPPAGDAADPFSAVFTADDLPYTVTTGLTPVVDGKGDVKARIFSTSYVMNEGERERPVMFLFNGGPGSSSVSLHSGSFGPMHVPGSNRGLDMPPPPYKYVENPNSLIDIADLVFVDPVGTGFSRVEEKTGDDKENAVAPDAFWGVTSDIESMVEFVRGWLFAHDRWGAEIYLAGESYGGLRAAGMADKLAAIGAAPSGVVLISPAISYQDVSGHLDNDVTPFVNTLPGLTATAHYHKRLGAELQALSEDEAVARAIRWSEERLAPALRIGNRLTPDERGAVVRELAAFTGLPAVEIEAMNLRVDAENFGEHLLRDTGQFLGMYDSRLTAPGYDWTFGEDPTMGMAGAPYQTAFMRFLTEIMGIAPMMPYEYLSDNINSSWDFTLGYKGRAGLASMIGALSGAMRRLPFMRVYVAMGRYDLVTPPESVLQSLSRLKAPADRLEKNIVTRFYEGGHMMYTNPEAQKALADDLRQWLLETR